MTNFVKIEFKLCCKEAFIHFHVALLVIHSLFANDIVVKCRIVKSYEKIIYCICDGLFRPLRHLVCGGVE